LGGRCIFRRKKRKGKKPPLLFTDQGLVDGIWSVEGSGDAGPEKKPPQNR